MYKSGIWNSRKDEYLNLQLFGFKVYKLILASFKVPFHMNTNTQEETIKPVAIKQDGNGLLLVIYCNYLNKYK